MSQFTDTDMLSLKQETAVAPYRIVKVGTEQNSVVEATDATERLLGVSNAAASDTADDAVGVITSGTAKVYASAAISIGDEVTATTAGAAVTTTTAEDYTVGTALEAATAAGDIIEIALNLGVYPTA